MLVGVLIVIISIIFSLIKHKQTKTDGGFIFFIGPFPVLGGATKKEIFYLLLIISIIFIFIFLVVFRKKLI